jgi:uncharacterized protein
MPKNFIKMSQQSRINISQEQLAQFCQRNHIVKLALFGSVLREDFKAESDIDVLVEFEPDRIPGLAFFEMETELTRIFGRKVDLNTPGFLSSKIRTKIQQESAVQYVKF